MTHTRTCAMQRHQPVSSLTAVLSVLAAFMLVAGCGEDSGTDPGPGGHVDYLGRPIIPCAGDLCFDFDSDDVQAAIEAGNAWAREMGLEPEYLFSEEEIVERRDMYAACNYTRAETGIVVVECPDWVRFRSCPGRFFPRPHDPRTGAMVPARTTSGVHYCVSSESPAVGQRCTDMLACVDGDVCAGQLVRPWAEVDEPGHQPVCLPAGACAALEEIEWPSGEQSCFYGDFTRPVTGAPEVQVCGELPAGACAANCACPDDTSVPELGAAPQRCMFVSEDRPIGVCGTSSCRSNADCAFGGRVCARVAPWPQWAEDYLEERGGDRLRTVSRGVCTDAATCTAWEGRTGGVTCAPDE